MEIKNQIVGHLAIGKAQFYVNEIMHVTHSPVGKREGTLTANLVQVDNVCRSYADLVWGNC